MAAKNDAAWSQARMLTRSRLDPLRRSLSLLVGPFSPASRPSPWDDENLVRAELFSIERLEQHARSLATAQRVASHPIFQRPLADRLRSSRAVLLDAYQAIAAAVGAGRSITPAGEWLLDNFHIVEDQIREIRADLPPGYYQKIPSSPTARSPRAVRVQAGSPARRLVTGSSSIETLSPVPMPTGA